MAELLIGRLGWDHLRISTAADCLRTYEFKPDVEIRCGVWRGKYEATFECGELRSFASELRDFGRNLSGSVSFETSIEQALAMTFKGDGRGHVWLEGVAQERSYNGPKLIFQFNMDQTALPEIINALEALDPPAKTTPQTAT